MSGDVVTVKEVAVSVDAVAVKEGVVSGGVVVVDEDVGDSIKVDEVSVRFVEVVAELSAEKVSSL